MKKYLVLLLTSLIMILGCSKEKEGDVVKTPEESVPEQNVAQNTQEPQNEYLLPAAIDLTKPNPALNRADSENTLVVGYSEAAGNFLPIFYATAYDAPAPALVFEGLLKTDERGEYEPSLAESLPEISEDGKTYIFKIKEGIKFNSGNPLTADDVVFTYATISDPAYDGRFTSTVQDLVGYEEYSKGETTTFKGVEKIDDYTVKFHFKENLVTNILKTGFSIMDSKFYAHDIGDMEPVKSKMQQLSGTGPYKLEKFVPRQYFELVINEDYHGEKPKIKRIIVKSVTSATDVQELINGDVDLLAGIIEPEKLELANKTGFIDKNQYLRHGYGFLMFNNQDPILKDKTVRKALSYGFDREAVLALYFKGLGIAIDATISKAYWTWDEELEKKMIKYTYDPEKAKAMLEEDGWKLANDGFRYKDNQKFTIEWATIKDLNFVDTLMPILIANYKDLGINMIVTPTDFNSLMDKVYNEKKGFSLFNMATSLGTFPDPSSQWHSKYDIPGASNTGRFRNEKNDELIDKLLRTYDREEFKKLWQEWALLMNEEAPLIPLYTNIYTDLYNRRIKNFKTDTLYDWTQAVLKAELVKE